MSCSHDRCRFLCLLPFLPRGAASFCTYGFSQKRPCGGSSRAGFVDCFFPPSFGVPFGGVSLPVVFCGKSKPSLGTTISIKSNEVTTRWFPPIGSIFSAILDGSCVSLSSLPPIWFNTSRLALVCLPNLPAMDAVEWPRDSVN